jgi:hypothetical protein
VSSEIWDKVQATVEAIMKERPYLNEFLVKAMVLKDITSVPMPLKHIGDKPMTGVEMAFARYLGAKEMAIPLKEAKKLISDNLCYRLPLPPRVLDDENE